MNTNFSAEEINFLKSLLSTVSPSGCETECTDVIHSFLQDVCNLEYDMMGNLYAFCGSMLQKGGIMFTAHTDEVGFQVTKIVESGLIYLRRLGGLDRQSMPGTKLVIAGKSRDIIGVFGKSSPHVQNEKDKLQTIDQDNLWVDFGFKSRTESNRYISIGDYVGVEPNYCLTKDKSTIISKGLDNKISIFILAVSLKRILINGNCPQNVTFVFTVQEEIGCRGAIVATNRLLPNEAICLDVGIATDIPSMTGNMSLSDFNLHDGPGLCNSPDNNRQLIRKIENIAVNHSIKHQITTGFRPAGGTETSKIQIEGKGVSTAHISIPNRYMHSAVEMCSLQDAYNCVQLIIRFINNEG